jgi:hypothetical protein
MDGGGGEADDNEAGGGGDGVVAVVAGAGGDEFKRESCPGNGFSSSPSTGVSDWEWSNCFSTSRGTLRSA